VAIYLYCVTEPTLQPPANLLGLAAAPVRAVAALGAAAWASDLPADVGAVTPELARTHDLVVRAALALETPLPARFGQTFTDEGALRRSLDARSARITRALERVRGAVEMTLRILLDEPVVGGRAERPTASTVIARAAGAAEGGQGEGSGRAYLDWLRERQHVAAEALTRAEFLQARVARAVLEIVREEASSPPPPAARSLGIAHLLARGDVGRYRAAVHAMARREPPLRMMVSGPWAPYSFAGLTDG